MFAHRTKNSTATKLVSLMVVCVCLVWLKYRITNEKTDRQRYSEVQFNIQTERHLFAARLPARWNDETEVTRDQNKPMNNNIDKQNQQNIPTERKPLPKYSQHSKVSGNTEKTIDKSNSESLERGYEKLKKIATYSDQGYGKLQKPNHTQTHNPAPNMFFTEKIEKHFPWIVRSHYLPNFFTKREISARSPSTSYQNATMVFVHNQKSGGSTLKVCMENIGAEQHYPGMSVVCDMNAGDYYTGMANSGKRPLQKFFAGGHTFKICDFAENPCTYVTVLRHPLDRIISSYEYCKKRNELHCQIIDANNVTLNQWAIFQGSFFFRQLFYNFEVCTQKYDDIIDKLRMRKGMSLTPNKIPCWYRNELVLEAMLSKIDKLNILQYVLDNLENWFAVIGINEEYNTFLQLLEDAFRLPFSRCQGNIVNYHQYLAETRGIKRNDVIASFRQQLRDDPAVTEALFYDLKIYEKAKDIFNRQSHIFKARQGTPGPINDTLHF
ncbi:uncharacterized protein LOC100369823 [Saccoglossus kowalevskii]|uniref:Uncharacterized protein LOC100369823 n=1 Tax=Saccoglossus kowalevskii TaxID=10224 RepID=A0ABM0GTE5_SACKO|nr:PREDICTED: uncharacterized protein LOC100369823 [Saccoglossus kowalevskii]